MKQKYILSKSGDKKQLMLKELAEMDKDIFSVLCEETYNLRNIRSALSEGLWRMAVFRSGWPWALLWRVESSPRCTVPVLRPKL